MDDNVFEEPLFEQIEKAMGWLKGHFKRKFIITDAALERTGTGQREQEWEYPLSTVREGIINAVCHRDYKADTDTVVKLFDDHLVIWNAGTLPPDLTAADLLKPHKSFPHNKLIAQAFYNTGIIEHWGSGTTRMAKELEAAGLPAPEFDTSSPYTFKLTLCQKAPQTKLAQKLNDRQRKALEHLAQNASMTNADYQLLNKVGKSTSHRDLAELVGRGLVEKRGTGKATEYLLP